MSCSFILDVARLPMHAILENERAAFTRVAEELKPMIQELDSKLPTYHCVLMPEHNIHKLTVMVSICL